MPTTMIPAKSMRVYVSATIGNATPTLVGGMNSFSKTTDQTNDSYPTFEAATAAQFPGPKTTSVSLSGAVASDDAGQEILRNAEASGAIIEVTIRPNALKGYIVQAKVTTGEHTADASGTAQETSFTLLFQNAPVAEASGGFII